MGTDSTSQFKNKKKNIPNSIFAQLACCFTTILPKTLDNTSKKICDKTSFGDVSKFSYFVASPPFYNTIPVILSLLT
jgi:hypothetical protein